MTPLRSLWCLPLMLCIASCSARRVAPEGVFIGQEPMPGFTDPVAPDREWFHENTLEIRESEVVLEKVPIAVSKQGKKFYSASDGGFFTSKGRLVNSEGGWYAHLLLVGSDYILMALDADGKPVKPKEKSLGLTVNLDGTLLLDGVLYRRKHRAGEE